MPSTRSAGRSNASPGYGSRVAVENPGFPPLFDLLDQLGLERVPVTLDRQGMRPDELRKALEGGARVVVVQPRAQNPTAVSMTATRARELAGVLRRHEAIVIEDDHSGEIASARDVSLGVFLPDRVVHVRSYSKSHGPDLRIAAVGGPATVLDALVARRMLGPGWTSRLLQHVLVDLLTDSTAVEAVAHARRVYFARRRALRESLATHGVVVDPGDGINLWLPVHDERTALVRLEAAGIRVAPGSPFLADHTPGTRTEEPSSGEPPSRRRDARPTTTPEPTSASPSAWSTARSTTSRALSPSPPRRALTGVRSCRSRPRSVKTHTPRPPSR